jgi:mannosyltransferase OCH1-like enzyme
MLDNLINKYSTFKEWLFQHEECFLNSETIKHRNIWHPEETNIDKIEQQNKIIDKITDNSTISIPLISHQIWFTNPKKPKMPSPEMIKWSKTTSATLTIEKGWSHIFWVNDKKLFGSLIKELSPYSVEFREISDLRNPLIAGKEIYKALSQNKFALASDIFRFEVLNQFGGMYHDIDYEIINDPSILHYMFDSYISNEPFKNFMLSTSFIGFSPSHPYINHFLQDVINYSSPKTAPMFLKNCNYAERTMHTTGPVAVTIAYLEYNNTKNTSDIVLNPTSIFPPRIHGKCNISVGQEANKFNCDNNFCTLNDQNNDLVLLGCNYWTHSWMNHAGYNSNG